MISDRQYFTVSKMASSDSHELIVLHGTVRPSVAHANGQLEP